MSATSMYTCIHSRCSSCNVDEDQHTHRVSPLAPSLDSKTLKISILYERTDESAYSSDKQSHTTFARKHTHTHNRYLIVCFGVGEHIPQRHPEALHSRTAPGFTATTPQIFLSIYRPDPPTHPCCGYSLMRNANARKSVSALIMSLRAAWFSATKASASRVPGANYEPTAIPVNGTMQIYYRPHEWRPLTH